MSLFRKDPAKQEAQRQRKATYDWLVATESHLAASKEWDDIDGRFKKLAQDRFNQPGQVREGGHVVMPDQFFEVLGELPSTRKLFHSSTPVEVGRGSIDLSIAAMVYLYAQMASSNVEVGFLNSSEFAGDGYDESKGKHILSVQTWRNVVEHRDLKMDESMDKGLRDMFDQLLDAAIATQHVRRHQLPQMRKDRDSYQAHIHTSAALEGQNEVAQAKLAELDARIVEAERKVTTMTAALDKGMSALQQSILQARRIRLAKESAKVLAVTEPTQVQELDLNVEKVTELGELEGERAKSLAQTADAIEAGLPIPQPAVKLPGGPSGQSRQISGKGR